MNGVLKPIAMVALGALAGFGPALPAAAHATLVKSTPAADSTLPEPPPIILAWFSEEVAVKGSVMRLYDAANTVLAVGGVDLSDKDHESMKIVPPHLSPGSYLVRWHAISADDNHVTEDTFRFTVQGAARSVPGPSAQRPPAPLT